MSEVTLRSTENQAELLQSSDISIYFSKMIAGRITLSPPSLLSSSYRYILPGKGHFHKFPWPLLSQHIGNATVHNPSW